MSEKYSRSSCQRGPSGNASPSRRTSVEGTVGTVLVGTFGRADLVERLLVGLGQSGHEEDAATSPAMPHNAIERPMPPSGSDRWPAISRPATEPSTLTIRSNAFDVPRSSVGNSSASSVPSAMPAAAEVSTDTADVIQSSGAALEEEDHLRRRGDQQRDDRDRLAARTARRGGRRATRPIRPGSAVVTVRNSAMPGAREVADVLEVLVHQLRRRRVEDVGEEPDRPPAARSGGRSAGPSARAAARARISVRAAIAR